MDLSQSIETKQANSVTLIKNKFLDLLNVKEDKDLDTILMEKVLSKDIFSLFDDYLDIVGGLERDFIMEIYSNFLADRKGLKQDYTPQSLGRMIAKIANDKDDNIKTCYDCCCGSGSLTLEFWKINPDVTFYMHELDTTVMPFLLFNLMIRGINADVINGNVLSQEIFRVYSIRNRGRYSSVELLNPENYIIPICDVAISNPPFNLSFKDKKDYSKYCGYKQTAKADGLFCIRCLEQIKEDGKVLFIEFPGLNYRSNGEEKIRQYIIENNILDCVICLPDSLFVNVSVETIIWFLDKDKKHTDFLFLDNANCNVHKDFFIRYKNGTYGGASHENRVYIKKYDGFDDGNIEMTIDAINERCSPLDYYVYKVNKEEFNKNYNLAIGKQYFEEYQKDKGEKIEYICGKDLWNRPIITKTYPDKIKKKIDKRIEWIRENPEEFWEEYYKKSEEFWGNYGEIEISIRH